MQTSTEELADVMTADEDQLDVVVFAGADEYETRDRDVEEAAVLAVDEPYPAGV